ncbi:MAG: hypothetical protein ABWX82_13240 [Leifsonia sp.]
MNDLRAELLRGRADAVPEFSLVLPSGWSEFDATAASEQQLVEQAAARLRAAHRPDMLAQLRALTGRAFSGMRSARTVKFYIQTDAWDDDLVLPLSITASLRTAPDGGTLDTLVADLIRTKGGKPLSGDQRFVRWETQSDIAVGSTTVGQLTTAYVTPVPGTERRQAMQFTAVVVHPTGGDYDRSTPVIADMIQLSDAIVSTLAWRTR